MRLIRTVITIAFSLLVLSSCAIDKWAVDQVANVLTAEGGGAVFTGEDDPQLVADALPFALKLYESLLETSPENTRLLLTTGQGFCMYAFAFVQSPAETLPDTEFETKKAMLQRAKRLFLRGRDYILKALEIRRPGFNSYLKANNVEAALELVSIDDIDYLYWGGLAWMGAFTTDSFDLSLLIDIPKPIAMLDKVLVFDETYADGGAHDVFISYYGSLPASAGGSEEKARSHFQRSVEISQGRSAAPYLALATAVSVAKQNVMEFRDLMQTVLALDVELYPENRLANLLSQDKAQWLLEHIDLFFIDIGESSDGG